MEGISHEAASLAGHLGLSNLCWIYDNNHITIEGNTALTCSDDVATRFIGYGWNVTRVGDANDLDLLSRAFETFRRTTDRPTLIIVDSHIGYGAPTQAGHQRGAWRAAGRRGDPRRQAQLRLAGGREVPGAGGRPRALPGRHRQARRRAARRLDGELDGYREQYPDLYDQANRLLQRQLPDGWDRDLRRSRPIPRASQHARPRGKCSTRSRATCPG